MKKIVIANWKMRLSIAESVALARDYVKHIAKNGGTVVACPSEVALASVGGVLQDSGIQLGAQNVFWEEKGEYTGEVAPRSLVEAGCSHVIIGHSERRLHLLENYEMVHQKLKTVLNHSALVPIVCVGETLKEKESGKTDYVIVDQLQQSLGGIDVTPAQEIIVAYEPIWAIGTGNAIQPDDVNTMHEIIGAALVDILGVDAAKKQTRIIYGGSVNTGNINDFKDIANVDGFLVGTASMAAGEFAKIISSL